jgi:hypothetical protein
MLCFSLLFFGIHAWKHEWREVDTGIVEFDCQRTTQYSHIPSNHLSSIAIIKPRLQNRCKFIPRLQSSDLSADLDPWQVQEWDNRYRLDVRFVGTSYCGFQTWNKQEYERTIHAKVSDRPCHHLVVSMFFVVCQEIRSIFIQVQQMLRDELRAYTRSAPQVNLIGAARTDAGVHALELPAHFDLPLKDEALALRIAATGSQDLLSRWNRRLPPVNKNPARSHTHCACQVVMLRTSNEAQ